jgi:hypothetical protein
LWALGSTGLLFFGDPLGELKLNKVSYKNPRGEEGSFANIGGEGQGELKLKYSFTKRQALKLLMF